MSTRRQNKEAKKTGTGTRKNKLEYSPEMKGYIRRMSEPLYLEPYYPTPQQIKQYNDKYGPMLTSAERTERFIMKTSKPHKTKTRTLSDDDSYIPSYIDTQKL